MSRDNHNYGAGRMGNNHSQNRMVADVAYDVGISVQKLSDAVHSLKSDWDSGDFSYSELKEIAENIKKNNY